MLVGLEIDCHDSGQLREDSSVAFSVGLGKGC
jgi:hypothetical protein